jgi:hypothetical protein
MTLQALPTTYDLTNPESNLADLSCCGCRYGGGGVADLAALFPPAVEDLRVTAGAQYAVPLLAGLRYYRSHGPWGALLGALAGYMAPMPTAGVMTYLALQSRR